MNHHRNRTLSSWRARMRGAACLLLAAAAGAGAYDLTPDLGPMAYTFKTDNQYVSFKVWNVGKNDYGPVNNCGSIWASGQWRDGIGKRIGPVENKVNIYQTSMNPLTNGWFTPNPQGLSNGDCHFSTISRGWDDEYGNTTPNKSPVDHTTILIDHWISPTLHERVDPGGILTGDENIDNNEAWVTTSWNNSTERFEPMENLYLPFEPTNLTSGDSLFYGVYSTNPANGNIYVDYITRTTNLVHGNEKVGYMARRVIVNLTGGVTNTYTIKNGSKVRAELLGQNKYGSFDPP